MNKLMSIESLKAKRTIKKQKDASFASLQFTNSLLYFPGNSTHGEA